MISFMGALLSVPEKSSMVLQREGAKKVAMAPHQNGLRKRLSWYGCSCGRCFVVVVVVVHYHP